jgi:Flp pilus assembly protein TadG
MSDALRRIHRLLARERRGMALVEFAMLAPLMLLMLLGSVLGSGLMLAYMKVNDAAETAVDLITQCTSVTGGGTPGGSPTPNATTGDLQNFANAALGVLYPLDTTQANIAFASVSWNAQGTVNAAADWLWPTSTTLFSTSAVSQVQNLQLNNTGFQGAVVIVNMTYTYQMPFTFTIPGINGTSFHPFGNGTFTFNSNGYSYPRYTGGQKIPLVAGTATTC